MPSPGMVTTVCFAMNANSYVTRYPTTWDSLDCSRRLFQAQSGAHQVLHAAGDHQRLRHRTQRREGELLAGITHCAGRKVDFNLVARDNRLLPAPERIGQPLAQAHYQHGRFNAQESVVERVAQVGLRKAAGDHQGNTGKLQGGDRLFAARAGAKAETAHDHVARPAEFGKSWVVVLHDDFGHHFRSHVLAIGIVLAVDAVGVEVVLRQEDESAAYAAWEPCEDLNIFGRGSCGREDFEAPVRGLVGDVTWPADVTGNRRRRHDLGAGEIAPRIARAHASFEVAVGGGDADLARFQEAGAEADARPAARRQRFCSRVDERLPDAVLYGFVFHRHAGGCEIELDTGRDLLASQDFGRGGEVLQARVHAGDQVRLLDRDLLLLDFGNGVHDLHGVWTRNVRGHVGEIEHDASSVHGVGIRHRRVRENRFDAGIGDPRNTLRPQLAISSLNV